MIRHVAIIIAIAVSVLAGSASAQDYRYEIGGGIGMSGYLGDANKSNMFKSPGFAAGALFKYIIDYRWALKASLNTASVSGNSADWQDVYPQQQNYSFSGQLYDLGAQMEFNFFNFGMGYKYKRLHRLSPYLTAGLGMTLGSCSGNTSVALCVPFGVGVKYKLRNRLNLAAEFTMRKTFGDKLDNFTLDDLNGIKSSALKNTDWYSLVMVTVSYEFGYKCRTCHYVD